MGAWERVESVRYLLFFAAFFAVFLAAFLAAFGAAVFFADFFAGGASVAAPLPKARSHPAQNFGLVPVRTIGPLIAQDLQKIVMDNGPSWLEA